MILNIAEFKETLELNRAEIEGNHSLTNEYLIDDIMSQLGYNKRRNKDVKRLSDKIIDWEVLDAGKVRLAVKVFALGEIIDADKIQDVVNYCKERTFSILVITNGETLNVYRYNKVKLDYALVKEVSLTKELDDVSESVLTAISNDGFDLGKIDSILSEMEVSTDKVREVMVANVGVLASQVATWMGDSGNSVIEQCKVVIGEIISNENGQEAKHSDVETTSEDIDKYLVEIKELQDELESAKTECDNKDARIAELENEIASAPNSLDDNVEEIENIKAELNNTKEEVERKAAEIEKLNSELASKDERIAELENEIASAPEESANTNTESGSVDQSEIDAYREQIQELTNKLADSQDEVVELNKKLEDAENKLDNMSGADRQKAIELINVIEDSDELPRSYVAVINTELLQYDALHTFVGRTLQKLYELKSYEASQFIFNGDIFKIVQPAERNDLIMNNKAYDVKIDGIHEDEVLNKLRIVFSHFSDVIFECKKIGSTSVKEVAQDNSSVDTEDITVDNNEEEIEITENTEDTIDLGDNNSDLDSIQLDESFDTSDDSDDFEDTELQQESSTNTLHGILCGQLLQIDQLIWNDEPIEFNTIKYIGSSSMNFNINMNCDDMSNEQLFCRSLDAILALAVSAGDVQSLYKLRQTDLSQINNFIKLYTEEYAAYPRINGTKYAVAGIDSVKQVASVLYDLCMSLDIDTSDIFLFFDATTESEQIMNDYGYEEMAIQLREETDTSTIPDEANGMAVLKGNIFSNIIITKNSLQAHRKIFGDTLAIKTNYLQKLIKVESDVTETIREILCEAVNHGRSEINYNSIGNVIGEKYKLVSNNANEVNAEASQVDVNGTTVYISKLESWQVPLSVIKVHTALMANTSIAIKLGINTEALNFYINDFVVAEPSLALAVASFSRYVESCLK